MDPLERLLNLLLALRTTRAPRTAEDIRRDVAGYGDGSAEAFRRRFERDKAALRTLGVPVETVALDRWSDEVGYRIDPARADLPPLDFTSEELAALALAARAAGLSAAAGGALAKIAVDSDADPQTPTAVPIVSVPLATPHLAALSRACAQQRVVRFSYSKPGSAPTVRRVDAHGLVHRDGRWYLLGRDHARDAARTFRLDRIDGSVTVLDPPGAFPPATVTAQDVVAEPGTVHAEVLADADAADRLAGLAVEPFTPAEHAWLRGTVVASSPQALCGALLACGPAVEVLAPAWVRARIVAALTRLAGAGDR